MRSYHPGPYVSAEVFYESQYQKWNTTALYAGCLLPLSKHFQFDAYYEHQNITSKNAESAAKSVRVDPEYVLLIKAVPRRTPGG